MQPVAERETADVPLILHVVHRFDVGGMENGLVNLINRIPESRYRHAIVCLTDYSNFKSRLTKKVELFAIHKREGKDLGHYMRLWRVLRKLHPDIIHTRNLAALESQFLAMLAGVRGRIHGEHGRDVRDIDGTSRKYRSLRAFFQPIVSCFIPLSRELERYLSENVGISKKKIDLIRNGVDTDRFKPPTSVRLSPLTPIFGSSDRIVIGSVGRMEAVKDPLTLARAFQQLVSAMPGRRMELRLVMIGDGSLHRSVRDALEEAKLTDIVWLPGSRDDIPDLLQAMDVFVLPSLAEGISNTILEAMASGLPVVATNVGGNPEVVAPEETGFLVPRSNPKLMSRAIGRYVDNAELRRRHGANGRATVVRGFTVDRMVEKYVDVYDRVLRESNGRG